VTARLDDGLRPGAGERLRRAAPWLAALAAGLLGLAALSHYYRQDLTLVHYDSKARLLVARRAFDNMTPGIDQIGMYWLPLPALLDMPLVLNDALYKNGIAASLLSVLCFAASVFFLYRIVYLLRSDHLLASAGAFIFGTNAAVLYVQSTPLTESLYFALSLGAIAFLTRFLLTEERRDLLAAGAFSALATLVRHDGWSLCAGLNILLLLGLIPSRTSWQVKRKYLLTFLAVSVAGLVAFQVYCLYITGTLFPPQQDVRPLTAFSKGDLLLSIGAYLTCAANVAGRPVSIVAAAGLIAFLIHRRFRPPFLTAYALLHPIPLFTLAYFLGHPYRVRYTVVLIPAIAVFAVAFWPSKRWARPLLAALVVANLLFPLSDRYGMLKEATYHQVEIIERQRAIEYLEENWHGEPVLASMGWIAPFLQDWGVPLRYVVHEGVFGTWEQAMSRPELVVEWMLVEKRDVLAQAGAANPKFYQGFEPVLELSNFTIYRRTGER